MSITFRLIHFPPGPLAASVLAGVGAFALSGQAVGLTYVPNAPSAFSMPAGAASFVLTGQSVQTEKGFRIAADAASFSLAGQSAALIYTPVGQFSMPAASAAFVLTGQSTGGVLARRLSANAAAFALTGQDASLAYQQPGGYSMPAGPAAFSVTGVAAGLSHAKTMAAGFGSFSLTGVAAGTLRGFRVAADAGAFSVSGQAVNVVRGNTIAAGVGAFAMSGQAVLFGRGYRMAADAGAFILTGEEFFRAYQFVVDAGAFTLTGQDVNFRRGYAAAAGAGAFTLTGMAATLTSSGRVIGASFGAFALTGQDVTLTKSGGGAANTFDPANKDPDITLSNGNLTAHMNSDTNYAVGAVRATPTLAGKGYCRFVIDDTTGTDPGLFVGAQKTSGSLNANLGTSTTAGGVGVFGSGATAITGLCEVKKDGVYAADGFTVPQGTIIDMIWDFPNLKIAFRKDGTGAWSNSYDPATSSGGVTIASDTWKPVFSGSNGVGVTIRLADDGSGTAPAGYSWPG